MVENHPRLGQNLIPIDQNRHLAHFIEPQELRTTRFPLEKVDKAQFPRRGGDLQHQSHLVGIATFANP